VTTEPSLPAWLTEGGEYTPWWTTLALLMGSVYFVTSFADFGGLIGLVLTFLIVAVVNVVLSSLAYFVYADA